MKRRDFILGAGALAGVAAVPAWAAVNVADIDAYLRNLRTATGRFTQTNPNGSVQTGQFMLAKPGRIRFEYDSPKGAMVVSDGSWVGVFDPKSNRNPTRYPLKRTPLYMLLRDDVSLAEPGLVLGATEDAAGTHITVVDPRAPDEGRLVMTFGTGPVELRQWVVQMKNGQRTKIEVESMTEGAQVSRSLFNLELEATKYR
ncbi:LolA family protein [Amaricoccus tamworthensis]|uniref:LolA family protein n=1 Tax=Amaricoccus tamworthensis TaxID=57002 RepID=UPI003C79B835